MEDCSVGSGAWKILFITGFIQIKFFLFLFFISKKERIEMHIAYSFNGENSEIDVNWTDSDGHSLICYSQYFRERKAEDENAKKILLLLYTEVLKKLQDLMNIYLEDHAYQCKFRERRRKKEKSFEEIEEVNLSTQFEDQLLLKVDLKIVCKN